MKAISLWQPWASLVVVGHKKIETRHWHPPQRFIGKRIAIHAAQLRTHDRLVDEPYFDVLAGTELAHGAIVGTVILKKVVRITPEATWQLLQRNPAEHAFGNYAPGRFAWVLTSAECFAEPVPCRGRQGFFDVDNRKLRGTIRA